MVSILEIKNLNEFLQSVLGNNVKIINIISSYMIPPGENYGGEIVKIDIKYQENNNSLASSQHFVAKMKPKNDMLSEMFNIQNTFQREVHIYLEIIPMLTKLQEEFQVPVCNVLNLFPKCYGARLSTNDNGNVVTDDALILFENLKVQNYVMEDRMVGFDLEKTNYFLEKLAQFHALPIALKVLKPNLFEKKIKPLNAFSFGDSYSPELKQQFLEGIANVLNAIEDCKMYTNKILERVDKGFKFEERFLEPGELYGTVVHHDLWINNFLIRNDTDGKLLNIKTYDFQLASFASFAHDLIFFLFTSVQQDIFDAHYTALLKTYYNSFINCLNDFNINTDAFTWQSFMDEINKIGPYQISHIIIMMRPIFMRKNKINDNSEMDEKELGSIHDLDNRYIHKMRKNVLAFVEQNWL